LDQPPLPTISSISPGAELPGTPLTLTGTQFLAGSNVSFGGVAGTNIVVNSPTSLTVTVPAGMAAGSAPVVGVRFYGLNTELARLQAADPAVTLANLQATQYSGPNEDCELANDLSSGEHRTLAAPASTPTGTPWFMAQLVVADHFSEFYLTGSITPLPVELTTFTATFVDNAAVRLAWTTASEKNSPAFEVERSVDGRTFRSVGTVATAGSSSAPRHYELLDSRLPAGTATLYCRLRQVDQAGTFAYSPVHTVALSGNVSDGLTLAPNPARTTTLAGAEAGASVQVFDAVGRLAFAATADALGTAQLVLPALLPAGMHLVRSDRKAVRIAVQQALTEVIKGGSGWRLAQRFD
jgi:hypothetical protein